MADDEPVSPLDLLLTRFNQPNIAQFLYYGTIMTTGLLILAFLSQGGFQYLSSIVYMLAWFILIIMLQPPEKAMLQSEPFAEPDIFPETPSQKSS